MHGDAELQEAFDIACMLDEHQVVSDLDSSGEFPLALRVTREESFGLHALF